MFSPDETVSGNRRAASLEHALATICHHSCGNKAGFRQVQKIRPVFFCNANASFSRLWHGLEQTASKIKAHHESCCIMYSKRHDHKIADCEEDVYGNVPRHFGKAQNCYNTEKISGFPLEKRTNKRFFASMRSNRDIIEHSNSARPSVRRNATTRHPEWQPTKNFPIS